MTSPDISIGEDALLAYADGQLDGEQLRAVEAYLAANPDKAAEVANWQRQNEAIHALFGGRERAHPVPSQPAPARTRICSPSGRELPAMSPQRDPVVLGSGIGWFGRDFTAPRVAGATADRSRGDRPHALRKGKDSRGRSRGRRPEPDEWLRTGSRRPSMPRTLRRRAMPFSAGACCRHPEDGLPGPAAQLMYENASAQRVTLYITAALPDKKGSLGVSRSERRRSLLLGQQACQVCVTVKPASRNWASRPRPSAAGRKRATYTAESAGKALGSKRTAGSAKVTLK